MQNAKSAVSDFMSQDAKHDTTVHQNVNPSVTQETVRPERHEQVTTALDKEIHQDHYKTSVQPIQHQEVLPEQHHHNVVPVEERHHEHYDQSKVDRKLEDVRAQFKDTSITTDTKHSTTTAPAITGEHVHHHVHEMIQPVVQKDTIQPHIVHTTVPIHEVHHNAALHHKGTTLPAMTMEEFTKAGGTLKGAGEYMDKYDGEPKGIDGPLHAKTDSGVGSTGTRDPQAVSQTTRGGMTDTPNMVDQRGDVRNSQSTSQAPRSGTANTPIANEFTRGGSGTTPGNAPNAATAAAGAAASAADSRRAEGADGLSPRSATGHHGVNNGVKDNMADTFSHGAGNRHSGSRGTNSMSSGTTSSSTHKKPSLLDRLNPKKDANGDGKAGFMS